MTTLKWIGWGAFWVLLIDFSGFISWVSSGQQPVDGFYIGAITANIIRLFI